MKEWFKSGAPWIWLNAGAVAISLVMVLGVLWMTAARGLGHFWPAALMDTTYTERDGSVTRVVGEVHEKNEVAMQHLRDAGYDIPGEQPVVTRYLIKVGNRDIFGADFRWLPEPLLGERRYPRELVAVERHEWGNLYGYLLAVKENGAVVAEGEAAWPALEQRLQRARELHEQIYQVERKDIGELNYGMERLRLRERRLELAHNQDPSNLAEITAERRELQVRYDQLQQRLADLYQQIGRDSFAAQVADGQTVEVPLAKVVRVYQPNDMGILAKIGFYLGKLWEFVSDDPREANTEGGIFPAIFGTVMMVIIMSIFVTPFGVIAAVYLREYAKQGPLTRLIRISVNNLAGVPSIVYGVFGLGFFVYFLGSNLDRLFFPESLPAPTFGTPGILWSSLTLALLTVPVVIVATEEGLARVPRAIREGSLALGATKAETLWRTVLPIASPAMMTGLILAIARAAGEVAPLMLVGVVKLAPSLPLDGVAPFVHLERKFMHLGFHIYDVGFQSPNVEAARPLVYATALLLVCIIMVLNFATIYLRNRLREKYRLMES